MTTQDKSVPLDEENTNSNDAVNNANIRNSRIYIRVNEEEKKKINKNAGKHKTATYLRNLGLRKKVKTVFVDLSPEQKECDKNLKGIGNNLNQLVTIIHTANKRGDIDSKYYISLLTELQRLNDGVEEIADYLASHRKTDA